MAYIDPTTSSTLVRVIAPIFIIVAVFWVQFRQWVKSLIHRLLRNRNDLG